VKSIQLITYFTHSYTEYRCQLLLPLFGITLAFAKGRPCSGKFCSIIHDLPPPPHGTPAPSGPGPSRGLMITLIYIYHIRQDSSGRVISPTLKPLRDNTQHSQETDIHNLGGIQTHNPSKQANADPHVRPRDHWDLSMN
jgi:hypothetical protein